MATKHSNLTGESVERRGFLESYKGTIRLKNGEAALDYNYGRLDARNFGAFVTKISRSHELSKDWDEKERRETVERSK